jgi:hypothetical protein
MNSQNAKTYLKLEPRLPSRQMRAVLTILATDPELDRLTTPFVDIAGDSIFWNKIFAQPMSSGHRCALEWACVIWSNHMPDGGYNIFDASYNLDMRLRGAILKAMAVAWGVLN